MPKYKILDLSNKGYGSHDIMEILENSDFTALTSMDISFNPTDNGITYLAPEDFPNLVEINISYTAIDDLGFLQDLPSLRIITANGLKITSLAQIAELTKIEELRIAESNVNNLNEIERLFNLRVLDISETLVDETELVKLVKLPNLTTLIVDEKHEALASGILNKISESRLSNDSSHFFNKPKQPKPAETPNIEIHSLVL